MSSDYRNMGPYGMKFGEEEIFRQREINQYRKDLDYLTSLRRPYDDEDIEENDEEEDNENNENDNIQEDNDSNMLNEENEEEVNNDNNNNNQNNNNNSINEQELRHIISGLSNS